MTPLRDVQPGFQIACEVLSRPLFPLARGLVAGLTRLDGASALFPRRAAGGRATVRAGLAHLSILLVSSDVGGAGRLRRIRADAPPVAARRP